MDAGAVRMCCWWGGTSRRVTKTNSWTPPKTVSGIYDWVSNGAEFKATPLAAPPSHAVAAFLVSQAIRRMLVTRFARPIFTVARASPTVRMTNPIGPFCQAKTCSTAARTFDLAALALAMRSGMGLPFGFFLWIADVSPAFLRCFSFFCER